MVASPLPAALGDPDPQLPTFARSDDGPRVPPRWQHSSDGVRGEIARPLPAFMRFQGQTTRFRTWESVPGVTVTSWDETTARGPIRAHLMSVALDTPGLTVDYAYAGVVRRTCAADPDPGSSPGGRRGQR